MRKNSRWPLFAPGTAAPHSLLLTTLQSVVCQPFNVIPARTRNAFMQLSFSAVLFMSVTLYSCILQVSLEKRVKSGMEIFRSFPILVSDR